MAGFVPAGASFVAIQWESRISDDSIARVKPAFALALLLTFPASADIFITKSFVPRRIAIGGTAELRVQLSSPVPTTVTVTDVYPTGLVNAAVAPDTTLCPGATVVAVPGSGSATITANVSNSVCRVTLRVTSSIEGLYKNEIAPGVATATNGDTNSAPARAWLNVGRFLAPVVTKSFSAPTFTVGEPGRLTITLTNPNADFEQNLGSPINGSFTDEFPDGLLVAPQANISTNCGIVTPLNDNSGISFFGEIPEQCTIGVDVVASRPGTFTNVIPAGAISSPDQMPNDETSAVVTALAAAPIPALSPLALALLAIGIAFAAVVLRRA